METLQIVDSALYGVNGMSTCARLSFIQFKVLHSIHFCIARLSQIYSSVDEKCNQCHTAKTDLAHIFWHCSKLARFRAMVFGTLL